MTNFNFMPYVLCHQVTTYHIYMASQTDCHVTVTQSRQHQLSPDSASPIQFLTLRVNSINPAIRPFDIRYNIYRRVFVCLRISRRKPLLSHHPVCQVHLSAAVFRLNSTEYAELREKLHAPIRNAANVVIHQTISELFLDTFRAQVDLNQPYTLPSGQVDCYFYAFGAAVLQSP